MKLLLRKYGRPFAGGVAQVLQRVTGVMLLGYLLLHVLTIHKLSQGPAAFNTALATFKSPLFKLLEIGLLATVIVHALNGIRVTLVDLGVGHERQRQLFWGFSLGVGALLFLAGATPLFLHAVLGK